jgi:Cu-processing system permease protein
VTRAARAIWAIAWNTFREAIRNKILHGLLIFALALIASALALGQLSLGEQARLVRDLGLGGTDLFGVLLAIFVGVNLLYQELERRTIYVIVTKPLRRPEFIVGKFLGMALTLGVNVLVMGAMLALVGTLLDAPPDAALLKALVLLYAEVLVVTAVALLFSSFSTPFLSGLFTLGIFLVGRSLPELEAVAKKLGGGAPALRALATVMPNLHLFFVSGASVGGRVVSVHGDYVPWSYVASTCGYGLCYVGLTLVGACLIFARRDFV